MAPLTSPLAANFVTYILVRYDPNVVAAIARRKRPPHPTANGPLVRSDDFHPIADRSVPQRDENDDDLDLLTYNEARVRLAEEIVVENRRRDALRKELESKDRPATRDELGRCEERLNALQGAASRTRSAAVTPANTDQFYGSSIEPPQD